MIINPYVKNTLAGLSYALYGNTIELSRISINNKRGQKILIANDYCFWVYRNLTEDIAALSCLIGCTNQIEYITGWPILTILRSAIEKYADIVNFENLSCRYEEYLCYLAKNAAKELDEEAKYRTVEELKKQFNVSYINPKTKYHLLKRVNHESPIQKEAHGFNQGLSNMHSDLSKKLHGNPVIDGKTSMNHINETLRAIYYMVAVATEKLYKYENLNDPDAYVPSNTGGYKYIISQAIQLKNELNHQVFMAMPV